MMGVFAAVTLSALFNLGYVLHIARTTGYFAAHDPAAMAAAAFNLILFGATVTYAAAARPLGDDETGATMAGD
jgi:hypothetical protein